MYCIESKLNFLVSSPRMQKSKDTIYLQTAYQLIIAMDPTELADPNGFTSSRSAFMLEEPCLQDNQLPTVSAPIVIESGDESEATQQEALILLPIPLTQAKGNNSLTLLYIKYIQDLPEYPVSHIHGYTYVVAVGNRSQEEMEKIVHDV
ncbi:hypothetical protein BJX65DRAFT_50112 [Aspergillus insuetus]